MILPQDVGRAVRHSQNATDHHLDSDGEQICLFRLLGLRIALGNADEFGRQIGIGMAMYTDENRGVFPVRTQSSGRWIDVLFDYYYKEDKIRCCPTATKPVNPEGEAGVAIDGETFKAWGRLLPCSSTALNVD